MFILDNYAVEVIASPVVKLISMLLTVLKSLHSQVSSCFVRAATGSEFSGLGWM